MNATFRLRLVAATTVASALIAFSGPAWASGPTTSPNPDGSPVRLAALKGRGDTAIERRLLTLGVDAKLVSAAVHLTAGDRQALLATLTNDQSGLGALKTKIDNDVSVSQAMTDVQSVVTAYRVYVLVDPKIHETIAADRVGAAASLFKALATDLQNRINSTNASGRKLDPGAQTALNTMIADVAAAEAAASPVPGQVLPLNPSGYPGNAATLQAARQALETARHDLRTARSDAGVVVADLH